MRRFFITLALLTCMFGLSGLAVAALYKYVDDEGVLHVVSSIEEVPARYRDRVKVLDSDLPPAQSQATQAASSVPAVEPTSPKTDEGDVGRFEVPYTNEGSTQRIIIPVTFNDRLTAPMALDTGAPGMVISLDLAIRLGIFDRDSGTLITSAGGIGGRTPAILTIIDSVAVESARDEFIPTTITAELSAKFAGLIGMDFLSNYKLTVDSRRQVVVFEEAPPRPDTRGGHDERWWRDTFAAFGAMSDGWREYARALAQDPNRRDTGFVEFQSREADRLLQRLHLHASANSVPRHWR